MSDPNRGVGHFFYTEFTRLAPYYYKLRWSNSRRLRLDHFFNAKI